MQIIRTDREILDGLHQGGQAEAAMLRQVYLKNRPVVNDFILKNNGSTEEAKDVFQESIVAFYENVKSGKFKGESAISTYIYSIARFNWLNKLKRKGTGQKIIDQQNWEEVDEGFFPKYMEREQKKSVLYIFGKLGSDCQKVLAAYIYRQFSMKEIAAEMNYENEQVARNKKYKCLKKLKDMIKKAPDILENLTIR